ncbi:DNA-3-methyladenine glycosylase I [Ornithinibacillus sp. FSL M8-0202]|uniref:DNA-3-methyladenine glycosylase I n=1 Tax=Ornithinibacillus sp. JPR2-1 TaxID=2094019 RepID=UPI0030CF2F61
MSKRRCAWAPENDELYCNYHDYEWGRPVHDDQKLFEMLTLEGAQAGLSWITILRRRENYRQAFDQFDPTVIATYDEAKIQSLRENEGIIRHEGKIRSVISNAKAFLAIQKEFGSFDSYIWSFVGGEPLKNRWESSSQVPAETKESQAMSKDLKRRGFKFVGPTICYAYMQATGMVHDHTVDCYLYEG